MVNICPNPRRWAEIHKQLQAIAKKESAPPPPIPLILNGWVYSNDVEKAQRWTATVEWAKEHGCEKLAEVPEADWYAVDNPSAQDIGPMGGPMHLPWKFDPSTEPAPEAVSAAIRRLNADWSAVAAEIAAYTLPIAFTGEKKRRLVVRVSQGAPAPNWGEWNRLAHTPSRRNFTEFRRRVNAVIAPLEVDHIEFEIESAE